MKNDSSLKLKPSPSSAFTTKVSDKNFIINSERNYQFYFLLLKMQAFKNSYFVFILLIFLHANESSHRTPLMMGTLATSLFLGYVKDWRIW